MSFASDMQQNQIHRSTIYTEVENNYSNDPITASRETRVSRHHGEPHEVPLTSQHYGIAVYEGGPKLGPIMPRDANHSDSRCKFCQSGAAVYF